MGSNTNNSTAVLVTGAALVAASLGLGYLTLHAASATNAAKSSGDKESKSSNSSSQERALATVTEIDEDADDVVGVVASGSDGDVITESDVCQIFDKLFLELQHAFSMLMNQVQQLEMTGQRIPPDQLQQIMKAELEKALTVKQGAIIEDAGIDADCLDEAAWEFLDQSNNKVRVAVERLQKLWQTATGEPVVGWRPGKQPVVEEALEAHDTIAVAEAYFSALTECMRDLMGSYRNGGKDLQNPVVQRELNLDFAAAANEAGEAALAKLGVSQNQFEASVSHHKNNPDVARALAMLQMRQQQDFASMEV